MPFKPDIFQKAQKVIFYRKTVKISHPSITFNTTPAAWQKYTIPETLSEKLSFNDHILWKFQKQIKEMELSKTCECSSKKLPWLLRHPKKFRKKQNILHENLYNL